jgi:hypothetical protein
MLGQMILFGVRGFRVGRELENVIETTLDALSQQSQQPKPPKPDPQLEITQIKADAEKTKAVAGLEEAKIELAKVQQNNIYNPVNIGVG